MRFQVPDCIKPLRLCRSSDTCDSSYTLEGVNWPMSVNVTDTLQGLAEQHRVRCSMLDVQSDEVECQTRDFEADWAAEVQGLECEFPNVYHAKTSSFCSFSDKNFATDPKIAQSQNTKSMVFATLSPKCYQKTRTKNMGKRKPRNVVLFTKTSQNTGFSCFFLKYLPNINDAPRAAADARAT